jgi:hypothetical protein
MQISKLKLVVTSAVLAASFYTLSAFAHENDGEGMMSSGDKMGGMMTMMSDMSPEDRQAMTKACMNMMQGGMQDGADTDMQGSADTK